jgi:hypothetical protein
VNDIVAQKGTNGALYAATDLGVFYRDNTLPAWIPFSGGLPNVAVMELEFSYASGSAPAVLRAATYGRGLWESPPYSEIATSMAGSVRPAWRDFAASPKRGGREIEVRFAASRKGDYRAEVFDAAGHKLGERTWAGVSGPIAGSIRLEAAAGVRVVSLQGEGGQASRVLSPAP